QDVERARDSGGDGDRLEHGSSPDCGKLIQPSLSLRGAPATKESKATSGLLRCARNDGLGQRGVDAHQPRKDPPMRGAEGGEGHLRQSTELTGTVANFDRISPGLPDMEAWNVA